jgi:hypothetical protein
LRDCQVCLCMCVCACACIDTHIATLFRSCSFLQTQHIYTHKHTYIHTHKQDAATASRLLTELESRHQVRPDLVFMNVYMHTLARTPTTSTHTRTHTALIGPEKEKGRWEECVCVLRSLPSRGLKPDVVSFNTVAHACARDGQVGLYVCVCVCMCICHYLRTRQILTYLKHTHTHTHTHTQVAAALGVLSAMVATGLHPNSRTFGSILDGKSIHTHTHTHTHYHRHTPFHPLSHSHSHSHTHTHTHTHTQPAAAPRTGRRPCVCCERR